MNENDNDNEKNFDLLIWVLVYSSIGLCFIICNKIDISIVKRHLIKTMIVLTACLNFCCFLFETWSFENFLLSRRFQGEKYPIQKILASVIANLLLAIVTSFAKQVGKRIISWG